jgi:hypothetical protein
MRWWYRCLYVYTEIGIVEGGLEFEIIMDLRIWYDLTGSPTLHPPPPTHNHRRRGKVYGNYIRSGPGTITLQYEFTRRFISYVPSAPTLQ